MKISIELPEFCHFGHLLETLYTNDMYEATGTEMQFHLPEKAYFTPESLAFLLAWALAGKQRGNTYAFHGSEDMLNYLSRMNLFRYLDVPYEEPFNRRQSTGRFIPISLINNYDDVASASDAVCELVIRQFDNARAFLPALEWSVNEIIDNVFNHACIQSPAAVYGQYYPGKHRLEVAVVDMGRGIKASLEEGHRVENHREALAMAIERGVTRSKEAGQGNGLAGTREIVLKNGGSMRLWSGDKQYHISKGNEAGFEDIPYTRGTGVLIKLFTDNPVDLGKTFITSAESFYIDSLCEQIEQAGSMRVKDQVLNTVTREAGCRLRRKIDALLPDMDVPLVLNFEGITSATSSFLDELLGKLYHRYREEFSIRIRLANMNETLQAMANAVIGQRLR